MALSYQAVNRSAVYTRSSGCLTFTPLATLTPNFRVRSTQLYPSAPFLLGCRAGYLYEALGTGPPSSVDSRARIEATFETDCWREVGVRGIWPMCLLTGWMDGGVDMTTDGWSHFLPKSDSRPSQDGRPLVIDRQPWIIHKSPWQPRPPNPETVMTIRTIHPD